MSKKIRLLNTEGAPQDSPLRPDEATDVLLELRRQAEQRLLDACSEFQDIAFEMEWRLSDYSALVEQRDRLLSTPRKFNSAARKRRENSSRDKAVDRLAKAQRERLDDVQNKLTECEAAIMTRNEEGRYLEQEIVLLQTRVERISLAVNKSRKRVRVVRTSDEAAAALARLALELSATPDAADADILLEAFEEVEMRRRRC